MLTTFEVYVLLLIPSNFAVVELYLVLKLLHLPFTELERFISNTFCLSFILKEAELLEPLMPAIRNCLEHRHSYVRRNAVMAIYTIYRYATYKWCN